MVDSLNLIGDVTVLNWRLVECSDFHIAEPNRVSMVLYSNMPTAILAVSREFGELTICDATLPLGITDVV